MNEIKVFLVEDEMVIRRGIKNSIDWEKEGYIFCGEASDGELAYPMIIKTACICRDGPERKTGYSDYRYPYAVHGWTGTL